MGYTHYWRADKTTDWAAAYPEIQLDATKIVKAAKARGIKLGDAWGEGKPLITEGMLSLNGVGDEGHESFVLPTSLRDFDFCKTARKPYDLVVTAILLRAAHHAPQGIEINSDGTWDEWKPARVLVEELFGGLARCPFDEEE